MELLNRMMEIQEADGAVTDEALRRLAREARVPLYRLEGLRGFYPVFRARPGPKTHVRVCRDIACAMAGGESFCDDVAKALGGNADVEVEAASCLGRCDSAPAATINEVPVTGSVEQIRAYATGGQALPDNAHANPVQAWPTDPYGDAREHYATLREILAGGTGRQGDKQGGGQDGGQESRKDSRKDDLVETLKASGLRGMGGAGFPTGMKWDFTRKASGAPKYVVCNADESEPGTFKDRMILEEMPHLLIEGMVLGGWVIGAAKGVIYLRHEYGRERKALEAALARAKEEGVLGGSVCGASFAFDIELFISPGGYILGEETALLEALEDKRGEPRNKPPFPTSHGLWGQPTLMNNVETFAAIPAILAKGPQWWADQGAGPDSKGYKGLKYISVSGDVEKPGVYCVPMGTTVRQLLETCGGMLGGKALAAFAPGGASSNFLPASAADVALDFQALQDAGSMLGSGAVIFVAEGRDLVEIATNVVRFFRNESCGKCVPCRVGSEKAVALLEQALRGKPAKNLIPLLDEMGETLAKTSICGLGQVALAPVLSIIRNFPEAAQARLGGIKK